MNDVFKQAWKFLDHTSFGPSFHALQSFAYDDTLCTLIGQEQASPTLRAWVHHDTIVLGTQDSRLPYIQDGISFLTEHGYDAIVRNSGGLAVVLDSGVLNLSLILKEERHLSIDAGYDLMYTFIKHMLKADTTDPIEAKEIVGSYCPGSYDLSIHGKKFAGISQRRIRGGIAVQIYLCVSGSGSERAALVRDFYTEAIKQAETKFTTPSIIPETMASLSELLGKRYTVNDILLRMLETMHNFGATLTTSSFTNEEHLLYEQNLTRVTLRNERCLA
ncbi:lipoate--protein ligase family protein [Halalkalibacter urbisdiaboli]|uniref:lipoate--protein ligase family protein n=1 Tax=Halalkalibacter urbisdiaboli TaxID=1960589 RepID=UPI000B451180|nr:biotin/lipoate A/B protein ligase family protein [Halalkalibacter urbisdiaboli]